MLYSSVLMGWVSEHLLTPYAVFESLWLGQHALPLGLQGQMVGFTAVMHSLTVRMRMGQG